MEPAAGGAGSNVATLNERAKRIKIAFAQQAINYKLRAPNNLIKRQCSIF
jgi:hypothetical protein